MRSIYLALCLPPPVFAATSPGIGILPANAPTCGSFFYPTIARTPGVLLKYCGPVPPSRLDRGRCTAGSEVIKECIFKMNYIDFARKINLELYGHLCRILKPFYSVL